jgi:hypothetical protein
MFKINSPRSFDATLTGKQKSPQDLGESPRSAFYCRTPQTSDTTRTYSRTDSHTEPLALFRAPLELPIEQIEKCEANVYALKAKPVPFEERFPGSVSFKYYQTKKNEGCPFCGEAVSLVTHVCEPYMYLMARLNYKKRVFKGDDILPIQFPKHRVKTMPPAIAIIILKQLHFLNHIKAKRSFCNCKNAKIFVEYNTKEHSKTCFTFRKDDVSQKFQCAYCHKLVTYNIDPCGAYILDKHRCRERIPAEGSRKFKTVTRKATEIPFDTYWNALDISKIPLIKGGKLPKMLYSYTKSLTIKKIKKYIIATLKFDAPKALALATLKFMEWEGQDSISADLIGGEELKNYIVEPCYFKIDIPMKVDQEAIFQRSRRPKEKPEIQSSYFKIDLEDTEQVDLSITASNLNESSAKDSYSQQAGPNTQNLRRSMARDVWFYKVCPLLTRCVGLACKYNRLLFVNNEPLAELLSACVTEYFKHISPFETYKASEATFAYLFDVFLGKIEDPKETSFMDTFGSHSESLNVFDFNERLKVFLASLANCSLCSGLTFELVWASPSSATYGIINQLNYFD